MIQGSRLSSTSPDVVHSGWVKEGVPQQVGGGRGKFFAVEGVKDLFDKQFHEPDPEKRKVLLTQLTDTLYDGGSATATLSGIHDTMVGQPPPPFLEYAPLAG